MASGGIVLVIVSGAEFRFRRVDASDIVSSMRSLIDRYVDIKAYIDTHNVYMRYSNSGYGYRCCYNLRSQFPQSSH